MPVTIPATFLSRFFCLFLLISIIMAILLAAIFSALDLKYARGAVIEDAEQGVMLAASVVAMDSRAPDAKREEAIMAVLGKVHNLSILCVYNNDNLLQHSWGAVEDGGHCPSIVRAEGTFSDFMHVQIAVPVMSGKAYQGIVYAEAPLIPLQVIAQRVLYNLLVFLLLAVVLSYVSAYYGARHMHYLMGAIRQQIDCLTNQNTSECLLMPANATRETMAMFDAIRNLRIHLESRMVPREMVSDLQQWYENVFSRLFTVLRERMPEDSVLITVLADCELFLHLNNPNESLPLPEMTDIAHVVDEARLTARRLSPPGDDVHLAVSLKPAARQEWMVPAAYLRTLIRHLLLIGLTRTHSGLVSLRLEVIEQPQHMNRSVICWHLEDSGPPMQEGALHSCLLDTANKKVTVLEVSWLLVVRLTKRLNGTIEGRNGASGLLLKGTIPVFFPDYDKEPDIAPGNNSNKLAETFRLILIVGESSGYITNLCQQLELIGNMPMLVANAIQAIELAPSLPFSAIILSSSMIARDGSTLRRLQSLMDNKTMPEIPVWVITTSTMMAESGALQSLGVRDVLLAPARQEKLAQLCGGTFTFDADFWSVTDPAIASEFSGEMNMQLPELRREFKTQLARVYASLAGGADKSLQQILHNVHSVKSAALALGLMRIALLMANLEHILVGKMSDYAAGNIKAIAHCLHVMRIE